jgi:hypothetical protein
MNAATFPLFLILFTSNNLISSDSSEDGVITFFIELATNRYQIILGGQPFDITFSTSVTNIVAVDRDCGKQRIGCPGYCLHDSEFL